MKRFAMLTSLAGVLFFASTAFSQIEAIGVGGGMVMPSGDFSNFAGSGYGGSVRLHYNYEGLENLMLTGSVGYFRFGSKEWSFFGINSGVSLQYTVIPLTSGGRYYFGAAEAKTRFYLGGEIGIHFFSVSFNDGETSGVLGNSLSSSTEFALIPVAGVALGPLDVFAQYSLSDFNYFGLQAMFVFDVGKK